MYNVGATQTTMYDVFTHVEMFIIVTIAETSTTIVPKNHNCCNSNHNCQNFLKKKPDLIDNNFGSNYDVLPIPVILCITSHYWWLIFDAKFRKTVIDAVLRD